MGYVKLVVNKTVFMDEVRHKASVCLFLETFLGSLHDQLQSSFEFNNFVFYKAKTPNLIKKKSTDWNTKDR